MSEPVIADTKPVVATVSPGTYWWCSCGRSAKQPFCDGSHKGTDFTPQKVTIEAETKIAWCACKRSNNGPRCDGQHKNL